MTVENNEEMKPDDIKDEVDYKAEFEKTKAEIDKYKKENTDFFNDMKKYKDKVKEYEAKMAENNQTVEESKSYKERFESLTKQQQEQQIKWQEKENAYNNERIRNKASTLANELEPLDADAAEMLTDYLERRLKMTEEGIAILDADGKVSNLKDNDLKEEFKAKERYKRLMRGRDSSGSGASGSGKVSGTSNLDHYAKMKPADRLTALREAGKAE